MGVGQEPRLVAQAARQDFSGGRDKTSIYTIRFPSQSSRLRGSAREFVCDFVVFEAFRPEFAAVRRLLAAFTEGGVES